MASGPPRGRALTAPPADLGQYLRDQRESRGRTLDDVSTSTKIKVTLLADLERNDLSRWPRGIYGRAFVRAYADAIGGVPAFLLDRLFTSVADPDEAGQSPVPVPPVQGAAATLRLTLAPDVAKLQLRPRQIGDAAIVLTALLAAAGVIAATANVAFLSAAGIVALVWYPVSHALFGGFSPSRWWRKRRQPGVDALPLEMETARPALRIVVPAQPDHEAVALAEEPLRQTSLTA